MIEFLQIDAGFDPTSIADLLSLVGSIGGPVSILLVIVLGMGYKKWQADLKGKDDHCLTMMAARDAKLTEKDTKIEEKDVAILELSKIAEQSNIILERVERLLNKLTD